MKRCGKCEACRNKSSPKQPCSAPVPRVVRRKPAKANEVDVTLCATIIAKDGEKKSVPVPDDDRKRSVKVVHAVRLQRKSGGSRETPEELIGRGWLKWLAERPRPNHMWHIVDKETGDRLGACAMPIHVSVDRAKSRATVELDSLMEMLQKQQMGAVSAGVFRSDIGSTERRFLIASLEDAAKLFCKDYLDGSTDVLDRKCRGVARKEDRGLVTHSKKGTWPWEIKAKFGGATRDYFILEATIPAKGGSGSGGGCWSFVGATVEEAQALCQRQVSSSVWKCAFDLTRPFTPSRRRVDGMEDASMAWTRVSPLDAPIWHLRHRRASSPSPDEVGGLFFDFELFRTPSSPPQNIANYISQLNAAADLIKAQAKNRSLLSPESGLLRGLKVDAQIIYHDHLYDDVVRALERLPLDVAYPLVQVGACLDGLRTQEYIERSRIARVRHLKQAPLMKASLERSKGRT